MYIWHPSIHVTKEQEKPWRSWYWEHYNWGNACHKKLNRIDMSVPVPKWVKIIFPVSTWNTSWVCYTWIIFLINLSSYSTWGTSHLNFKTIILLVLHNIDFSSDHRSTTCPLQLTLFWDFVLFRCTFLFFCFPPEILILLHFFFQLCLSSEWFV